MIKVAMRWLGLGMTMALVLSPVAHAQTNLSQDVLTLKAQLVQPACVLNQDAGGDEFDFGTLNPTKIAKMPASFDETSLRYTLENSAFGDFKAIYQTRDYGLEISVNCPSALLGKDVGRMQMVFGLPEQVARGSYGVASQGYAFSIDNEDLASFLALSLYVDDVYALAQGQNGLVKPGQGFQLVTNQTFKPINNSNEYQAIFRVTPGLFWIDKGVVTGSAKFNVEVPVSLIYN